MIERLIRVHAGPLQRFYDRMPRPVQTLLTSARGLSLSRLRYSREMFRLLRELRSQETWTAAQVSQHQSQALRHILAHARKTVPYYADYPVFDGCPTVELQCLPVITREQVRSSSESFLSRSVPGNRRIRVTTTGTTGSSLRVWYSPLLACCNWAFRMRQWAWAGVQPRHPRLTFFGSRIVPPRRHKPPFWIANLPERQLLASIYHLSERTAPHYLNFLRAHRNWVLEGFPSVLGILADFVLRFGDPLPMRVIFTDGEPLYRFLREKIERAFAARAWDSYGLTEYCGLIQQCEQGRMHLIPEFGFLEILDDENRRVPPGEEGYLVWTSLLNETMPLIRYRVGDRGCWQPDTECACGRAFPLVVPTITRDSDLLCCADGRIFSPRALNQLLKEVYSLRFCQFLQEAPDRVVIRAVPADGNSPEELADLRQHLQQLVGNSTQVIAQLVANPIVRAGGKIPLIIQQARNYRVGVAR